MFHLNTRLVLNVLHIPITRSITQQPEVSHAHMLITHTFLSSFRLKMCHLNSRLVLNVQYIQIARTDTQAEVSHVHTYITHTYAHSAYKCAILDESYC